MNEELKNCTSLLRESMIEEFAAAMHVTFQIEEECKSLSGIEGKELLVWQTKLIKLSRTKMKTNF